MKSIKFILLEIVLGFLNAGCTSVGLERATITQAETWTDIQYQQVMDNIAMFARNPSALPYHLLPTGATPTVQDSATGSSMFTIVPTGRALSQTVLGLTAERQVTQNWTVLAVFHDINKLQHAYQVAFGVTAPDGHNVGEATLVTTGWFSVGCRKDVPKNACYVGHYRDSYAWVMPDGLDGLGKFTLYVVGIADLAAQFQGKAGTAPFSLPLFLPIGRR